MSLATRLGIFTAIAIAGFIAWQWNLAIDSSHDLAPLAVQQLNNGAATAQLREASWAQNWSPFLWPGLLAIVGAVLFWDDVERLWKREDVQ